jgi:streptogramin lyase
VARVSTTGQVVTQIPLGGNPSALTLGPDGNMWVTQWRPSGGIWRITPAGAATLFSAGLAAGARVQDIAVGADGNLWFATGDSIGRITPQGAITEFPVSGDVGARRVAAGADGNIWFGGGAIGRITPQGQMTLFRPSTAAASYADSDFAAGPDGNVWFFALGVHGGRTGIGHITPGGVKSIDTPPIPRVSSLTCGPDGHLWFTALRAGPAGPVDANDAIGRLSGIKGATGTPGCPAPHRTPHRTPRPPVRSKSNLRAAALPIAATTHRRFTTAVALFTYPLSHDVSANDFSATINWGDGSTSPGHARAAPNGLLTRLLERLTHRGAYFVDGTHTYDSTRTRTVHIVVSKGHAKTPELVTHATVEPLDPVAFFYLNPDNPKNGDIALVVPQRPGPLQRPIRTYVWGFNDGGAPVVDDKSTRPLYKRALDILARDPGNPIGLGMAHQLGILPPLVNDAGTVSQMVGVWRQYFLAYHIVPHIYPNAGQATVALKVVDAAGHRSRPFSMPVTVSDHCLEWGGPLAGLFGHATTCETAAGLSAVVHGPSRRPDYYAFDVSGGEGVSAGFTVVVSHSRDVSIAVHAAVGPHLKTPNPTEVSVAAGFVGPPSGPVPSDELIDRFGASVAIPVQATLGPFKMTLILSPRCGCAGEEYGVRGWEGAGLSLGASCSIDLGEVPGFSDLAPPDHGPWPFQGGRVPQMSGAQMREAVSRGVRALTAARLQC